MEPRGPVVDQVGISRAWVGLDLGRREVEAFGLAEGRYLWDPEYGAWIRDHLDFPTVGHYVEFADVDKERWRASKRTLEVSAVLPARLLTAARDESEAVTTCLDVIDRVLRRYPEVAKVPAPPTPPTLASPIPEEYVESVRNPTRTSPRP